MNTISKIFTALLCIAFGIFAGFFGRDFAHGDFSLQTQRYKIVKKNPASDIPPVTLFSTAFHQISTNYNGKIDNVKLKYAAMEGLLGSLGDPHTIFMEPQMAADFSKETKGSGNEYAGIGARLQLDPQGVKLISIFSSSPADEAGLKPSDIVIGVDGVAVAGWEVEKVMSKIRGVAGSTVKLKILRPSSGETLELPVKRAKVLAPTADGYMIEGTKTGYINVLAFAEVTTKQFDEVLDRLDKQGMNSLVIDLRNNPGGLLETATEMLSRFVSNKLVVKTKGRDGQDEEIMTYGGLKRDSSYPVTILVNSDSASAAEIFSGVMRDYRLATLVGEHTYGKASVQRLFWMPDGSTAKVTMAKYFLPSGKDIMRKVDEDGQYLSGGIKPDVEVKLNLGPKTILGDINHDNQLRAAVEIASGKKF